MCVCVVGADESCEEGSVIVCDGERRLIRRMEKVFTVGVICRWEVSGCDRDEFLEL